MHRISNRERLWRRIREITLDAHDSIYAVLTEQDAQREDDEPPAVETVTYEQFRRRTNGELSFRSETEERLLLHSRREELVDLGPLYFKAEWGEGLNFTRNPALGVIWYAETRHQNEEPFSRKQHRIAAYSADHTNNPALAAWFEHEASLADDDHRRLRGHWRTLKSTAKEFDRDGTINLPDDTFEE